jgi:hypothetical protein
MRRWTGCPTGRTDGLRRLDPRAYLCHPPVVIVIVQRAVIDREERYLTAKFGEEYLRYKARVRRWL